MREYSAGAPGDPMNVMLEALPPHINHGWVSQNVDACVGNSFVEIVGTQFNLRHNILR